MPLMTLPGNLTVERIVEAVEADDNLGFCLNCGQEDSGLEPDARERECQCCRSLTVYGAEELLIMFAF